MPNRKLATKYSAVLTLFIITTLLLIPISSWAEDPLPATSFIYPVLGEGITDPKDNTVDPRPVDPSHEDCGEALDAGYTSGWYTCGDDFASTYTTGTCPIDSCGVPCVHPGEDWNMFPGGNIEGGTPVFAVANGEIVNEGALASGDGYYITVKHVLQEPENLSDYTITPTTGTFQTFYAAYLHINQTYYLDEQTPTYPVEKGDQIGTISSLRGHLHFEMRTVPGSKSGRCGTEQSEWCGYCSDLEDLTDSSYFEPDKFIRDHIEGPDDFANCKFFWDVWPDKWYFRPIMRLSCIGVIDGDPDGNYRPGDNVNHAETIKLIVEASGAACKGGCLLDPDFVDVSDPSEWYYESVKTAYNNGWLDHMIDCEFYPCNEGYFLPAQPATRGWVVHIMIKALGAQSVAYRLISPYDDIVHGEVEYPDVGRAYQLNVFSGYEDKDCNGADAPGEVNFCYNKNITRAEAAAVIERAFLREGAYQ